MRSICFENNVTFYNLSDFGKYQPSDYSDSVHLNGFGGKKLLDSIVDHLIADGRANSAMTLAGKELELYLIANSNHNRAL